MAMDKGKAKAMPLTIDLKSPTAPTNALLIVIDRSLELALKQLFEIKDKKEIQKSSGYHDVAIIWGSANRQLKWHIFKVTRAHYEKLKEITKPFANAKNDRQECACRRPAADPAEPEKPASRPTSSLSNKLSKLGLNDSKTSIPMSRQMSRAKARVKSRGGGGRARGMPRLTLEDILKFSVQDVKDPNNVSTSAPKPDLCGPCKDVDAKFDVMEARVLKLKHILMTLWKITFDGGVIPVVPKIQQASWAQRFNIYAPTEEPVTEDLQDVWQVTKRSSKMYNKAMTDLAGMLRRDDDSE